jgi:hypothetical protein
MLRNSHIHGGNGFLHVVFIDGAPAPQEYRRFRIKPDREATITPPCARPFPPLRPSQEGDERFPRFRISRW